jgi:hypothetical protein
MLLPNSPTTFWGFTKEEKLTMIARMRRNQTGVEQSSVDWGQVKEAYLDDKIWLFTLLGFVSNIPNGGISNFSTLTIHGRGFDTAYLAAWHPPGSARGYLDRSRSFSQQLYASKQPLHSLRAVYGANDRWRFGISSLPPRYIRTAFDLLVS